MSDYLNGQLLVAMPQMDDKSFKQSVVMLCSHDDDSAMGVVINHPMEGLKLKGLAKQIGITTPRTLGETPVFVGGPVEPSRGMVLHTTEHMLPDSINVNDRIAMTSNVKIINEIVNGHGPNDFIITLGHAEWAAGQLEDEIKSNVWLTMPFEEDLIFDKKNDSVWATCYARMGISAAHISPVIGNA